MYILLVTARADAEDLEQALAAGANDYLTKPLDARRLSVRLSVAERHIRELEERNQSASRPPGFRPADDRYSGENK